GCILNTRTFIPHRVHEAIGVLGSVSVASACLIPETIAHQLCQINPVQQQNNCLNIGHPTGFFSVDIDVEKVDTALGGFTINRAALLRTARLLMRGEVFIQEAEVGEL
nr:4-oxalomesaconate tautomerase [Cellvibrionaceae bacterium]